ncbi:emp24/gp25L/p24 family/GOLD-domain-containing protein [Halteromyces radiatus]|uniref:emp24/gp25L/p24 family/GOLD-domain-containing protein n=1 Tax=Halteromyces radiatus TaxID=101107 RepID=UPI002220106B|nr:emp24/gp25L/p24 family/GOLD-domain-containing protein [Halteromyces radiatus]KAI8092949.1 emp24/gp25L/p24 family/GOLD-domain-containing protein [Halteromyces radiatus]
MPSLLPCLLSILFIFTLIAQAVRFDLTASQADRPEPRQRCLSQFVAKDTQVYITVNVGNGYNQRVDLKVSQDGDVPNVYTRKRDLQQSFANAFNTISEGQVKVCFTNTLDEGFQEASQYKRWIDLDMNIGAEAIDYTILAKTEQLGPLELELRKLEKVVQEIVDEMNYLKSREVFMRDTNGKMKQKKEIDTYLNIDLRYY